MTSQTADVIVIGGGLHGCSAALHLADRGLQVVVIEKDRVGRHASGVNAGGVRRLGRDPAEVPLAAASNSLWHRISELVDDDCGFEPSGQVQVAENADEWAAQADRVRTLQARGFEHERMLDQSELRARMPAVAAHCIGGVAVDADGFADPYRTVLAFARKARSKGVQILEGAMVRAVNWEGNTWQVGSDIVDFEAPVLVNCAGAWGHGIAAMLGETVPLVADAPMLMITARVSPFLTPVVGAYGRNLSFKQFANGSVLIGGGFRGMADPARNRARVDVTGLAASARTAAAIFPVIRDAPIVRSWAGIEGFTPDGIPVIGPSGMANAFHAFGFCGHGFQLGPIVGQIIADLVMSGRSPLPIDAFRIDRFNDPDQSPSTGRPL